MSKLKTESEHLEYLQSMIRLSLWFTAYWKNGHPDESIKDIIERRTLLINHTTFNDNPTYDNIKCSRPEELESMFNLITAEYETGIDPVEFECNAMKLLMAFINGRVASDMQEINATVINSPIEAPSIFAYNLDSKEELLTFHLINTVYPVSFLNYPELFDRHLRTMVTVAEKAGFKGLDCVSWLNSSERFYDCFPKSWKASEAPAWDQYWEGDLGLWGQFLTANGSFNSKIAEEFRATGKVKYNMTECGSTISEFKEFLKI